MVNQSLGIALDNNSIKYAQKRVAELKRDIRDFTATVKASEPIAGKLSDTLRGAFSSQTSKRIADIADNTRTYKDETLKALRATEQLRDGIQKLPAASKKLSAASVADERFSQVSNQVGLFGDVETGLRTVGVGGVAPEILAAAEALPRLKVGLEGLPAQARAAAEALGGKTIGVIGAIGIFSLALVALKQRFEEARASAQRDLDARARAIELISAGSKEEVAARVLQLEQERDVRRQAAADAQSNLIQLRAGIVEQYGVIGEGLADINSTLGTGAGELAAAKDSANAANTALSQTDTELNLLKQSLGDVTAATIEATRKEQELAAARADSFLKGINENVAILSRLKDLAESGTAEQVQSRIDAIQREIEVNEYAQKATLDYAQSLEQGSEANARASAAAEEYGYKLDALREEQSRLVNSTLPLVTAREKEAKAAKEQEQTLRDLAGATDKYNKDVQAIEDRANEARAASSERLNDALVKAAESAAEAAESALSKLQEKRDDLAADFAQDNANAAKQAQLEQLDAQLDFQRNEARARREHARNLLQIQKDAADREQDLIDARDFAGLFDLRRDTQKRLNEANQSFNDEQSERRIAYAEQLSDLATAYQRERETRALQYQQDLNDAAAQYAREQKQIEVNRNKALVAANNAYNREIQLANEKYNRELTQRQQAISAELQLIQQGGQARIALEAQIQKALVQQALNMLAGIGGKSNSGGGKSFTPTASAFGNNLAAMQASTFNELPGQRERFNGQMLPGGAGMLIPLRGGRVSPGSGGGVNFSMPVTINAGGGNVAQIEGAMNAIKPKMKQFVIETMAEVVGAD